MPAAAMLIWKQQETSATAERQKNRHPTVTDAVVAASGLRRWLEDGDLPLPPPYPLHQVERSADGIASDQNH